MNKEFYAGNRKSLYQKLEAGSLVVVFSGHAPIKTNDENYPFFTNRNFLYLTGIEQENIVLMAYVGEGTIEETLYLLPPDAFAERWTGRRIKEEEAEESDELSEEESDDYEAELEDNLDESEDLQVEGDEE